MRLVQIAVGVFGCCLAPCSISAQTAPSTDPCTIIYYPAERLHSVGEDFDAVHKLDQDLKDYDLAAGRPLGWLDADRQRALLDGKSVATLLGHPAGTVTFSATPLKRSQALAAGPHLSPAPACLVEVMVPQLLMERGGLSFRSLRLFGVVRHYQDNRLVSSYSGFAVGKLPGFKLHAPSDAPAATALVEQAYVDAVRDLVTQSLTRGKPQ